MNEGRPPGGATLRLRIAGTASYMPARAEKSDERSITISCDSGYDRAFAPGQEVVVEWTQGSSVRVVHGMVVAATLSGARPRLAIRPTHPAELMQRRDNVRVRAEIPFTAWTADGSERGQKGVTIDVSGSGMLAGGAALELWPDDEVEIALDIPGQEPIDLVAVVARLVKPNAIGFRYTEILPGHRDRLIRYLFKVQSDQLARRAGARTS